MTGSYEWLEKWAEEEEEEEEDDDDDDDDDESSVDSEVTRRAQPSIFKLRVELGTCH